MPNYCNYEMKVTGTKENVEEFITIIQADYHIEKDGTCDCDRHFWRVFEADVLKTGVQDNDYYAILAGHCAWSVYACMFDGEDTYNEDCKGEGGTSLGIETERLNLVVECFSEEPGCGFEEHYVFVNGKLIVDEVMEDYKEYDTTRFETVEEMNEHYGTSFTKEEFEKDFYLYTGGFKEWKYDTWR